MRVSVAVPCYNGAAFIGRTIESLLSQTCPADQMLVVDDGSIDNSAAAIRAYPVTLVQHSHNRGLAAARNTALKAATGEVVVYVDADAPAAPDLLELLMAGYLPPDGRLAGVGGQGLEANIQTAADRWRRAHASQGYGPRARDVPFLFGLCMSYSAAVLRQAGGFDEAYRTNAEDMDLGLRLTRASYRLRYLPAARVYHQRRDDVTSLQRAIAAWYGAAYRARRRNHAHPWTLFTGTLRRSVADPISDLVVGHDPAVARLSLAMTRVKLRALWRAVRIDRQTL
jgi:mycofactocin glycosyltransferase